MRSKSPELMSEIKKYIEDYYLQNRQSPSTTKIAEAVGIARGTAYKYLVEMAEKNMIEYDGQEIRTNVTRKYSGEQTQTPIVGSIPCGSPQYEEENIEEYVSLPSNAIKPKTKYGYTPFTPFFTPNRIFTFTKQVGMV